MMRIHAQIDSARYPNSATLARELEVSAKTIRRDVEFMRDQLGLPIEYDAKRYGYWYTEPVAAFPAVTVSEGEMVALFVARKALDQYRGTSFEEPLKAAFSKLTQSLQDEVSFNWSDLDSAISFRGFGGSTHYDLELFDLLSRSVLEGAEVALTYRKLAGQSDEERRVRPYHLTNVENCWYLLAHDLKRGEIRTFALPRIRGAVQTGERFEKPRDFDVSKFFGDSFGVFSGDGRYQICLWFDSFAAQLVSERMWHKSQKLREIQEDGWQLEMTMELTSLTELVRWVLGWGRHCRVISPEPLIGQVREEAKQMAALYRND